MREAQTEPHITASVEPRADYINLIEMVIENHGPGATRNVSFDLDGDFVLESASGLRLSDTHLFRHGISYLSPRQRVRFFVTSLIEHPELLDAEPMHLRVRFETCNGKARTADCYLDFRYLKDLSHLGTPDSHKMAEAAEKVAKELGNFSSGFHQLHVLTQTKAERTRERQEMFEAWRKTQAEESPAADDGVGDGQ